MNVGFIGLGHMGRGMAINLRKAGHDVRAWNRTREATADLASKGLSIVSTPAEAFAGDAVISMLADDAAARAVFLETALLDRTSISPIHIYMATISVGLANQMEERHKARDIAYVAAPVMGRPDVAAAAKLMIIAAGPADARRPTDELGVAIAIARNGPAYLDHQRGISMTTTRTETAVEVTCLAQIASWLALQPDFQYVIHSNTDLSVHNGLAFQVRFEMAF